MYGQQLDASVESPKPPIEPISSINQNTMSILADANGALEALLSKVRGNQPSKVNGIEKMPERHLMSDVRSLRNLAAEIFEKSQELHRIIGHEKQ